jgi:hypothetical protein
MVVLIPYHAIKSYRTINDTRRIKKKPKSIAIEIVLREKTQVTNHKHKEIT